MIVPLVIPTTREEYKVAVRESVLGFIVELHNLMLTDFDNHEALMITDELIRENPITPEQWLFATVGLVIDGVVDQAQVCELPARKMHRILQIKATEGFNIRPKESE